MIELYNMEQTYKRNSIICPKYWNFKEMAPIREEDVDPKLVIPEGAKEVDLDNGKYIYKLTDKYTNPGFIESDKNKYGYYLPCCFGMKEVKTSKTY